MGLHEYLVYKLLFVLLIIERIIRIAIWPFTRLYNQIIRNKDL